MSVRSCQAHPKSRLRDAPRQAGSCIQTRSRKPTTCPILGKRTIADLVSPEALCTRHHPCASIRLLCPAEYRESDRSRFDSERSDWIVPVTQLRTKKENDVDCLRTTKGQNGIANLDVLGSAILAPLEPMPWQIMSSGKSQSLHLLQIFGSLFLLELLSHTFVERTEYSLRSSFGFRLGSACVRRVFRPA
jgi:hypothetical protein